MYFYALFAMYTLAVLHVGLVLCVNGKDMWPTAMFR